MSTLNKKLTTEQVNVLTDLQTKFGPVVSRKQILQYVKDTNINMPWWLFQLKSFRVRHGYYNIESIAAANNSVDAVINNTDTTETTTVVSAS